MYEFVGVAGLGAYESLGSFGAAGDAASIGDACLCGPPGTCTKTSLQAAAMANLRAAMRALGIPTGSGNWSTTDQNGANAYARAHGYPASSKFLVDGGPCQAIRAGLSAPAPSPATPAPPAAPITNCATLLAAAPPVPPGTPVDTVIAVLQSLAPGFDVRACLGGAATPSPGPAAVVPPSPATPATPGTASSSKLPYLLAGGVALLAVGGVAFVALSPKMRANGRRRKSHRAAARPNGATKPVVHVLGWETGGPDRTGSTERSRRTLFGHFGDPRYPSPIAETRFTGGDNTWQSEVLVDPLRPGKRVRTPSSRSLTEAKRMAERAVAKLYRKV